MIKAKYTNIDKTLVQIVDKEINYNKCGLVSRYKKELEGVKIEPFETPEEVKKNAKEALREAKDENLSKSTVTYEGAEFQTRPSDLINFTTMLTLMDDSEEIIWTLADDSEKTITKADLQAVYLLGLQAGAMIDKDYRDAVRAL